MLQNYNKWKVLQVFFNTPLAEGGLQLREISRKAKLAPTSVKNYLAELKQESLIREKENRVQGYPVYTPERDSEPFKLYKKIDLLLRLHQMGLISDLKDRCFPSVIILFGSAARGEDTELSDIDLFVGSKPQELKLQKYEEQVQRKINVLFEPHFEKISKELKNNLLNGVILYGYLKVF